MKAVAPYDRPREKLARHGPGALGDNELVAILLGKGLPRAGALELANAVLVSVGGLRGLARAAMDDLCRVPGVGEVLAARLLAAIDLGRRTLVREQPDRRQIVSAADAADVLLPQFGTRPVEQFGVLLLDTKRRVIRATVLSIGTLDASVVHPREVFREATRGGAAAIILFHNHPSGDPTPSEDDVVLTWRMVRAGALMGIEVLDHVVLAETSFVSLREHGKLLTTLDAGSRKPEAF